MVYYKSIFDKLPYPCLLLLKKKNDFVIHQANDFYCETTHIQGKDWSGKGVEDLFPENPISLGLKEIKASFNMAYTSQDSHKIPVHRYDLFNPQLEEYEEKYWEIENIPIIDSDTGTTLILNVVKDITAEIMERNRCARLQIKLNDNANRHNQMFEGITDGLFSMNREGNFVSCNKGLIDIAETPEADLLGMSFLPFCGQEDIEKIVKKFDAAINGENQMFEANFITGAGNKRVLEISLVPIQNDGRVTGLYGIAKDISRLKESEISLLQSERKFKALVQEGSDLIGILDLEGRYKFVSETSTSVLGIRPAELVGNIAFDFIHPDDQERVMQHFSELASKNQIEIKPFRFKNSKGAWQWVETKATNLTHDPAIAGIVANSRDVTDRVNSQKAIKESEERYRSIVENSTDAMMVAIPDGNILAVNPSACEMFQRSKEEFFELGRSAILDTEDPRLPRALALKRAKGTATAELTFIRKDGTKFPGEITSSIFKDSEGNARSSVVIRDITERKRAEKKILDINEALQKNSNELLRANKGLEQFSYIISHNLRAPVANILGLTQLLTDETYPEEMRANLRTEIATNVQRMDKVIKDLNQILQLKQDLTEVKQTVYLHETVETIQLSLQACIRKENIRIITNFNEVDHLKGISSFIYSIFYNLIFNSIKFRQPGVETIIHITSQKENGLTRLVFEDNGLGMDLTKKKNEIFGLYKRFHHHVEGKGMGLFMVKTQVEMLGGKISVSSKVNQGTTFTIEIRKEMEMK